MLVATIYVFAVFWRLSFLLIRIVVLGARACNDTITFFAQIYSIDVESHIKISVNEYGEWAKTKVYCLLQFIQFNLCSANKTERTMLFNAEQKSSRLGALRSREHTRFSWTVWMNDTLLSFLFPFSLASLMAPVHDEEAKIEENWHLYWYAIEINPIKF